MRILLTGTFCSLNKGDAAMRIALISLLRKRLPSSEIAVMTPYPELDGAVYSADAVFRCNRREPHKALGMILRSLCWHAIYRSTRLDLRRILGKDLRIYRQCDLIVDLSGDGITEEYGLKCLVSHLVPIIIGKLLCRPVFICAQTIGPLEKTGSMCARLFRRVEKISAREKLTLDYLHTLGLKESVIKTADLSLVMKPVSPEKARSLLASEGVPFKRPLIGFSVSRLPGNIRGIGDSEEPAGYEKVMAEVLDWAVNRGLQPVVVSHSTGPGERYDDRLEAGRIVGLASHNSQVRVLAGDYTPEETKGIISQMDMFVGVRLHSCLAAISSNVPAVCIAYGPKAYGAMALAGQERWMIDIAQVTTDKLISMLDDAWNQRTTTREALTIKIPELKALAERNVEVIADLLSNEPTSDEDGNVRKLTERVFTA